MLWINHGESIAMILTLYARYYNMVWVEKLFMAILVQSVWFVSLIFFSSCVSDTSNRKFLHNVLLYTHAALAVSTRSSLRSSTWKKD